MLTPVLVLVKNSWDFFRANWRDWRPSLLILAISLFATQIIKLLIPATPHEDGTVSFSLAYIITNGLTSLIFAAVSLWNGILITKSIADKFQNLPDEPFAVAKQTTTTLFWPAVVSTIFSGLIVGGAALGFISLFFGLGLGVSVINDHLTSFINPMWLFIVVLAGAIVTITFLSVQLSFVLQATVLENVRNWQTVKSSWTLVKRHGWGAIFWRLIGSSFLFILLAGLLYLPVAAPLAILETSLAVMKPNLVVFFHWPIAIILSAWWAILVAIFTVCVFVVKNSLYLELKQK